MVIELSSVLATVGAELTRMGFKKRRAGIYTNSPAEGFLGWLGFNTITHKHEGIGLNPVVGVRCQELERRLAELSNSKFHGYIPPTISCPLGYLMPERKFRLWNFYRDETRAREFESLVQAVKQFGLPFIDGMISLEAISDALESSDFAIPDHRAMRLPLAEIMLGRLESASRHIESQLARLALRPDPLAIDQRRLFSKMREVLQSLKSK